MFLYRKNNLVFFLVIFLAFRNVYSNPKYNNSDGFSEEELPPFVKEEKHGNEEFKGKEISLMTENNKLKIQIEVYNIYLYFLIILNIIFLISLFSFIIYKKFCDKKETNSEVTKEEILLGYINEKKNINKVENNEINDDINDELSKDEYDENSMMKEEYLNNSGIEAPPAIKNL